MTIDEHLLAQIEALRIPLDDPTLDLSWKDWYHFLLWDQEGKIRILVNLTLAGRPGEGEVQVSFLVNIKSDLLPVEYQTDAPMLTFGTALSLEWTPGMVCKHPLRLLGNNVVLEIDGKYSFLEVQDERIQLAIRFLGEAQATPLLVTEDSPFGSGFIGWGLVPGLQVAGDLSVSGLNFVVDHNWFSYHDRNFGRFRWGEDIGWEWFVAFATSDDCRQITLALDQRTNKDHSLKGLPYVFVYINHQLTKIFIGSSLHIHWEWSEALVRPVRLPGIMASLFSDRTIQVPQALQVEASDPEGTLLVNVKFETIAELIIPDNQERQYTFIQEVTGTVEVRFFHQGEVLHAKGILYGEYVL